MGRSCIPLLLLAACAGEGQDPRASALIITLEGVNAEMIGAYGGQGTPGIDLVAAGGSRWDWAISPSPIGPASLASLMSGLYPAEHGLRDEGGAALRREVLTLAEALHAEGWRSAAFTGGLSSGPGYGLEQGFERFDAAPRAWLDPGLVPGRRSSQEVVDAALEALPELAEGGAPIFVWVSLGDAVWPQPAGCGEPGPARQAALSCMDRSLDLLVQRFSQLRPHNVVVISADQGGGPGDGGETLGLSLQDEVLRVPLILRGGGLRVGAVYEHPVSLRDLPHTLVRLLGLDPQTMPLGRDLRWPGGVPVSETLEPLRLGLAPLFAMSFPEGRMVRGEWGAWYPRNDLGISEVPGVDEAAAERSRLLDTWLLEHPRRSSRRVPLDRRRAALRGPMSMTGAPPEGPYGQDPREDEAIALAVQVERALRQGRLAPADRALQALIEAAPDAQGTWTLQASLLLQRGDLRSARALLEALHRADPSVHLALIQAELAELEGDWPAASRLNQEVLLFEPLCAQALLGQVLGLRAMGDEAEALALAAAYAPDTPQSVDELLLLAQLCLLLNDPEQALWWVEQAELLDPGSSRARQSGAEALLALGQAERALEELRLGVQADRFHLPLRLTLAELLLEQGEGEEALRNLTTVVMRAQNEQATALYAEALAQQDSVALLSDER